MGWQDAPIVQKSSWRNAPVVSKRQETFVPSGDKTSGWVGGLFGYDPKALGVTPAENIAGHPITRFAMGAAAPFLGVAQMGLEAVDSDWLTNQLKDVNQLRKTGQEAMGGGQFDAAGLAGTALSPAILKVAGALKTPANMVARTGQGAALGAGFGASMPVTEGDNYWGSKGAQAATGAVLGGAIPPAAALAKKGYEFSRNIIDPILPGGATRSAARMLAEAIQARRPAVERLWRHNETPVPGSQGTAAEVAAPAGVTELSGMQSVLAKKFPTRFHDIEVGQEAARRAALGAHAGDKSSLAAAVANRAKNAKVGYEGVAGDVVKIKSSDAALFQRPAMEKAFARAKQLTEEQGRQWGGTVQDFQNMKMALDDMVKDPATFGMGASEANAVNKTRAAFIEWLNQASPGWQAARTAYAADSAPINKMQVGQELEKALTNPLGTKERAGSFASAVQNAPRTIKRATGNPRFDEIKDVDPKLAETADRILADLQRKGVSEDLARLGAQRATEITGPAGLPATGPLHQGYMIVKTVLGRISKGTNEKSMEALAKALGTPKDALELLKHAPSAKRAQMIDALASRYATAGTASAVAQQEQF